MRKTKAFVPGMRGLMIDAARTPESLESYHKFIDFAAERGINTILLRLADDYGVAMKFERVKGLLELPLVRSKDELRTLAKHAAAKGVDLIPEVESFGHSKYITGSPSYAHLNDLDPAAPADFNGLCPVHPGSLELMRELYAELAEVFPSKYLHGGCDEVNWGGSELSKQELAVKPRHEIWADYVNRLAAAARSLGKELMVWADHLLRKESGALETLDRGVVLMDWDYWTLDPAPLRDYALKAMKQGFRVVGAPALGWCEWGPRVGRKQLYNIDAFAEAYRHPQRKESLGVLITNWCPWRYPVGSNWDGLAYAAAALRDGPEQARKTALRDFVESHYGATWDAVWAEAFFLAYATPEPTKGCAKLWEGPFAPPPWRDDAELKAAVAEGRTDFPPVDALLGQLKRLAPTVRRNHADFQAFVLAFEYSAHLNWRVAVLAGAPSPELIATIARRDQELLQAVRDNWCQGRSAPREGVAPPGGHEDKMMLHCLGLAAAYSAGLAAAPERFAKLLANPTKTITK